MIKDALMKPSRIETARSFSKHRLKERYSAEAWERRLDEPPEAFHAFCIYRDTPSEKKRTLCVIAEESGAPRTDVEHWAKDWDWEARSSAYDNHLIKAEIEELKRDRIKSIRKRVALARAFQNKVITRLNALNPDELSPADLIKWIEVAGRIEKQILNESIEIKPR